MAVKVGFHCCCDYAQKDEWQSWACAAEIKEHHRDNHSRYNESLTPVNTWPVSAWKEALPHSNGFNPSNSKLHWIPLSASSATTSRFLCIKFIDRSVKKFGHNEHPLIMSSFFCIFVLVVNGTQCSYSNIMLLLVQKRPDPFSTKGTT